ncbi:hypothetical protein L798_04055 [Zootermopsis nevadensis]|uniref:Uncharacterized protein n=1 Tax=Zootermopsis nevadensis TaxID=136037 RepID=A0A067QSD4_ZOONE|nr:hypothetical protein L798_04055 [Zootermopsis nevadensis]
MEVSQTSLELEATSAVFREGKLRLRCLATIFTLYRRSEELQITEDTPQLAPVMGPTAPHSLDFGRRSESSVELIVFLSMALLLVLHAR